MELLIWPSAALFILAVILRSGKRRDGIDWVSRGLLLLIATTICLLFDRWIRIAALNAAEAAASSGSPANSFAIDIRSHYQAVLLPLYIVIVAITIDVLARLTRRYIVARSDHRGGIAIRDLSASLLLFVAVPALPYAWAANFASSGSILGDAARDVLMPVIATYGAPAYWLQVATIDGWAWQRLAEANWPWNPGYRNDSYLSFYSFLTDCLPWITLTLLMSFITLARREVIPHKSFSEYFVKPKSSTDAGLLARIAFGPWRGRAALVFTVLWTVPLALWLMMVVLIASLSYVVLWVFVLALIAGLVGVIALVIRFLHRTRARSAHNNS
jgi:hypothetical protein